jgi:outer-membrane receptor for ferric coprogen and ferric-rhodotorulic acid
MFNPVRRAFVVLPRLVSILATATAGAQTPPAQPLPQDVPRTMPTVRVDDGDEAAPESYTARDARTATGLTLSLRETPQSVTVVTRERMDDQMMHTAADALSSTTGVSLKAVDRGRNNLTVRGFEVRSFQFDGVPVATGNVGIESTNSAIYDRIEVVRGATGLVTGAGEPSAAINLVRKHATSDVFTALLSAEAGSWNRFGAGVDLSTPLNASGSVRARFVADGARQDAFIDLEETRNTVLYAIIDADLGENTRLSLGASDQHDSREGVLWAGLPYWFSDGSRTDWGRSRTTATDWNEWNTRERTVFAGLAHDFANGWSLQANATHYRQREDSKLLWMWGDPDPVTGEGMEALPYHYLSEPEQTNASVVVSGPFAAWGRDHEITVGLMHSQRDEGWSNRDPVGDPEPVGSIFDWDGSYAEPALGERYLGSRTAVAQTGIYSAARLEFTDRFKAVVGGRFSNWKQEDDAGAWTPAPFTVEHEGEFTPYAGLLYDLTQTLTAYLSHTDIFTPSTSKDRFGDYLDPAEGVSYEAGIKGEFFGGGLNASLALFLVEQNNFPEIDPGEVVPGTTDPAYRAAQGASTEGYEIELAGALTPQWDVSFGWTHYQARDAEDADIAVDHPRRLLKVFTKYELEGALSGLALGGGVEWESEAPATAVNPGTGLEERVGMGSHALVDLMAEYSLREDLHVQLNVNNLLDEKYRSTSFWWGSPFTYGEPRNVVLSLSHSF